MLRAGSAPVPQTRADPLGGAGVKAHYRFAGEGARLCARALRVSGHGLLPRVKAMGRVTEFTLAVP